MAIINLTPHAVTVFVPGVRDEVFSFPPDGRVARVSSVDTDAGAHDDIPLVRTAFGEVVDLPEPQDGVVFIVSALVRSAVPDRKDVASPGTLIRDDKGAVIGCTKLIVN